MYVAIYVLSVYGMCMYKVATSGLDGRRCLQVAIQCACREKVIGVYNSCGTRDYLFCIAIVAMHSILKRRYMYYSLPA